MFSVRRETAKPILRAVVVKLYVTFVLVLLFRSQTAQPHEPAFLHIPPTSFRSSRLEEIEKSFWHRLTPFDGQWYQDIAVRGYRKLSKVELADRDIPPGNFAFFPLLPSILWTARAISPLHYLPLTILIVAWSSVIGTVVAGRIARELNVSGTHTMMLLAAFPTAFFQVMLYTEGLFLFLSGLTLYFTIRGRIGGAACVGALAGLCRPQGVLLAIPIAVRFVIERWRSPAGPRSEIITGAVAAVAPLCGFAFMSLVSYHVAGSPGAFLDIQSRWGRSYETGGVFQALSSIFHYEGPPFDVFGAIFGVSLIPMLWKRLPVSLAAYGTGYVVLPLLTGSILSMGRFMSLSIPHFLCLALLLEKRTVVRYVAISGMVILQVLIANGAMSWYFVG